MNRERLIVLRDFLTTVPEHRFEMARWFENPESNDRLDACGFAGCAAGWATTIPAFNAAGFRRDHNSILYAAPGSGVFYSDWRACERFFFGNNSRQSWDDTCLLFDGDRYKPDDWDGPFDQSIVTPQMVADRIDKLLARG